MSRGNGIKIQATGPNTSTVSDGNQANARFGALGAAALIGGFL